jgi:hypothetical protein
MVRLIVSLKHHISGKADHINGPEEIKHKAE